MPPAVQARATSPLVRPLVVLALPGMYLLYKYTQYRQQQAESARRRLTERELVHLHTKIDKLLDKLDENEPELASSQEDECVICVNARATMQTAPCGHRVVCRRCFVKTIQMAVSQRLLPLRCVICRAKILRLRHAPRSTRSAAAASKLTTSKSWQVTSSGGGGSAGGTGVGVPGSVSCYSVGARSVPASESLYSVSSGESSLSGVSSASSGSVLAAGGACAGKLCAGARCGGACTGAVPRAPLSARASAPPRQPLSGALRRSQHHSMKVRLQEYAGAGAAGAGAGGRLPPIREFQREFREGRRGGAGGGAGGGGGAADGEPPAHPPAPLSVSTRIRCAQKIVTQLETSPQRRTANFFRSPLRALSVQPAAVAAGGAAAEAAEPAEDGRRVRDVSSESKKGETTSANTPVSEAERRRLRYKAEKEAKSQAKREEKQAKLAAKEEERQAKMLAKEEERQAKLLAKEARQRAKEEEKRAKQLAKEEKKKAKREARLAAQAEK